MNNQQHLVEVVVGRILDKYNVSVSQDLSITDQAKVKSTVLDIQTEVDKFLENLDMDTVGKSINSSFNTSLLEKNLLGNKLSGVAPSNKQEMDTVETEDVTESSGYFERPASARVTRKRSPNMFVNRRRF
ncbi:hypothetical protein [Shouchella patagoniensis]|uniref:hypothetical protein n=1 Tax=Shouchella patagoniensis TaxID=228576 RepID=UPI0009953884|nr:hypothetical protein [Shouchella patagoniensis]